MPWTRRRARKLANRTSIVLSFIAGIAINLLASWFQIDILSNVLLLIGVLAVLVVIGYWTVKTRAPLLINAFAILIVSIFFNIFSNWVQASILHNKFTIVDVAVIFMITVIALGLSVFIGAHPISKFEKSLTRRNKRNARFRLAQEGSVPPRRRRPKRRLRKRQP
jgi:uncharacterized membrane protein